MEREEGKEKADVREGKRERRGKETVMGEERGRVQEGGVERVREQSCDSEVNWWLW